MTAVKNTRRKGELGPVATYDAYKKAHGTPLSRQAFARLLADCNKGIVQLLLAGVELKLPYTLGSFFVQKKKVNFEYLAMDYGHYRKTGQKLMHTNRHSDGFISRYFWRKMTAILPNKSYYAFIPARAVSRQLAVVMKQEHGHKKFTEYVKK